MKTCLTHFLGFDHSVGIEFLYLTGLLKIGNSRNPQATVVIQSEWEKFIVEEHLFDLVETLNRTAVSGKRYYFVHFGLKENLQHRPIDQFNGKKP